METSNILSREIRFLIGAACFVIIVAGMRASAGILVPFLLSMFIGIIFTPPMFWMQEQGVPKILSIAFIMAVILALGALLVQFLGGSVAQFTAALPSYRSNLMEELRKLIVWLNAHGLNISEQMVREYLDPGMAMQMAARTLTGLSSVLTNAFLIILTVIFILLEAAGFPGKIRNAFKAPEKSLHNYRRFTRSVNRYLAIKTLLSVLTGLLIWIWLSVLGLDFALLWGLLAFLLNYVPNIGSIIAAVPPVLLALAQLGLWPAALCSAGFVAVNVAIGNFLEPRFMGSGLGLSTLVVFLSLVFWGWVLGPVGMLLSVPLTMIFKIAMESNPETRWLAIMLGNETPGPQMLHPEIEDDPVAPGSPETR
ncbi:MAG: AI-2E family transporter [Desulfobacteraceae bacterium]|nr:AI-2E family transporter [Desulfobacteraceae bacterium]